jgi:hypothetical protein
MQRCLLKTYAVVGYINTYDCGDLLGYNHSGGLHTFYESSGGVYSLKNG